MTDRVRVVHPEGGRVLVKQAMASEVDANRIMEKWIQQGHFPRGAAGQPMFGDFSSGLDYQASLNAVMAARDEFMALPSRVRTACQNDPGKFLELCGDPEQLTLLRELGLAEQDIPEKAVRVEIVNQPEVESPEKGPQAP